MGGELHFHMYQPEQITSPETARAEQVTANMNQVTSNMNKKL